MKSPLPPKLKRPFGVTFTNIQIRRFLDSFSALDRELATLYRIDSSMFNHANEPEKHLINSADGIVRFSRHRLSRTLPQALIIICEKCSLFSCQL